MSITPHTADNDARIHKTHEAFFNCTSSSLQVLTYILTALTRLGGRAGLVDEAPGLAAGEGRNDIRENVVTTLCVTAVCSYQNGAGKHTFCHVGLGPRACDRSFS